MDCRITALLLVLITSVCILNTEEWKVFLHYGHPSGLRSLTDIVKKMSVFEIGASNQLPYVVTFMFFAPYIVI